MNAATASRHAPVVHPTHKFRLLLRREFWEHRGGFLWAPVVAGSIALVFTLIAAVGASFFHLKRGNTILIEHPGPDDLAHALGGAGDVAMLLGLSIALVVVGFVVFFYSLSSLYDDRRDRSILFWKSMPVSDVTTVVSKAVWALGLAPLLAVGIGLVLGVAFWLITGLTTTVNGVPGAAGIFMHSHPIRLVANVLAMFPLYVLWALPAVGWLMLCSAAVRSKPFLWALIVPVLGSALVSFTNVMLGFGLDVSRLWYVACFRGLLSVFPGSWLLTHAIEPTSVHGPEDIVGVVDATSSWALAGTSDLWIGALAGILMLYAAVRLRRWRDEG